MGEYGLIRLNCMERFENATTKCQIRKRWACNFAEWRFNFLRTWLSKFYQQYGDRDLPVPTMNTITVMQISTIRGGHLTETGTTFLESTRHLRMITPAFRYAIVKNTHFYVEKKD